MITPMKKVTVICMDSLKIRTLKVLRSMGVMHLVHMQSPCGNELNYAKAQLLSVQKALEIVPTKVSKDRTTIVDSGSDLIEELQKLIVERKESEDIITEMKSEIARFDVLGLFDPSQIISLESKGLFIRFYETEKGKVPLAQDNEAIVKRFGKKAAEVFVVINKGSAPVDVNNATEMRLPATSVNDMKSKLALATQALARIEERLQEIATAKASLKRELADAADDYNLKEADSGMFAESGVSMIQGFCPEPRLSELKERAPKLGWGLKIEEPSEDDNVPTLLSYNKLSRPMKFLYDVIGISPGYHEMDVSMVFLAFFSIFFAMIVGDAAYGLLFLGLTLIVQKKMPKAPASAFHFLILMSITTIVWGILNNTFLGFSIASLDISQKMFLPDFIRKAALWIREPAHVQYLCFVLGVTHLTIAHIWNFIIRLKRKSTTAVAQIGWLFSTWFMFFLASNMVLKKPMPEFAFPLFIAGITLIVLFMVPPKNLKKDWISFPMLIFDLVNNFVDIISYIRLFAVGMAGIAISQAFNMMLSPLFGSAVGIAVSVIALFFVHCLNIALGIMGVAVHALRLNTLEFSNHLDLQWSGTEFAPFSKHKAN